MRGLVYSTGTVRNKLICGYDSKGHASSSFCQQTHTHTHMLILFEDHAPTGLKVDTAATQHRSMQVNTGHTCPR